MPFYTSVREALADRPVSSPSPWDSNRWVNEPAADDGLTDEQRDQLAFWRTPRYGSARQELERWRRLALLDEQSHVVGEVTSSIELGHALRSRPDLSAWVPCDESTGLFGAVLLDAAALAEYAKLPAPAKLLDEPDVGRYTRQPNEARVVGVEVLPQRPRIRERLISPDERRPMADIGAEFLKPPRQRQVTWYAWRFPAGWGFRQRATGVGLRVVPFLPAEGSVIVHEGTKFAVSWTFTPYGRELLDVPPWLLPRLGRKL